MPIYYNITMSGFFEGLKYFLLSFSQKDKKRKFAYSNKTSKTILGDGVDVTFNAQTLKDAQIVKENVYQIVKQTECNPDKLLDYVQAANTPVYKLDYADKILSFIREEEGFITEKRGKAAIYLSLITGNGIKFVTQPMFILRDGVIDKYYMLHHFYLWYATKSNLPGTDYKSMTKFKQYLMNNSDSATKKLNMEDIVNIKEAIARDNEATAFVLEYTKEVEGAKKVIDKIKNDGGANI